ncbi:pre-mRNA-splicing factor CWC21-like [Mercurialis annua]|uniref:pre-mRNA-splicing factor CWC21-like n=1 Tax=Mercurialis annua TaxID=3986 RepID=UPI00215E14E4|nr:pre-mRNA-splicing factor CWC21-like [Mercurialis annua]
MFNGIGLQPPKGSATNGYIEANKFLINRNFIQETINDISDGVIRKKPINNDILEHDRKRRLRLQIALLQEILAERDSSDPNLDQTDKKLDETRKVDKNVRLALLAEQVSNDPYEIDKYFDKISKKLEEAGKILKGDSQNLLLYTNI